MPIKDIKGSGENSKALRMSDKLELDEVEKTTPVKDAKDNADLLTKDDELMLEVTCGQNQASLCMSRLQLGSKGTCVLFENAWLTPNEFQYVSGRETAKDWKRSIKHHGKSLKVLIAKGILTTSPSRCKCGQCIPMKETGKQTTDGICPVSSCTTQVSPSSDRTKLNSEQPGGIQSGPDDSTLKIQQDLWKTSTDNKQFTSHSLDGRVFQAAADMYSSTLWQRPISADRLEQNVTLNDLAKDICTHMSTSKVDNMSRSIASSQLNLIPDSNSNMKKSNHSELQTPTRSSQLDVKASKPRRSHEGPDSRTGEADSRKNTTNSPSLKPNHSESIKSSLSSNTNKTLDSTHKHSSKDHHSSAQHKSDVHHRRTNDTHISDLKSNSSGDKITTLSFSKVWPTSTSYTTTTATDRTENKMTDSRQIIAPFTTPYANNFFGSVPQLPMYYPNPYVLWPMTYPPAAASLPYGWAPPFGLAQPECIKSPNTLIGGYRQMEEMSKCESVPLFNFPWMKGADNSFASNKINNYNSETKWGPESPRLLSGKRKLEEPEALRPTKLPYYLPDGTLFPDNQSGTINPFIRQSYNMLPVMADLPGGQSMFTNNLFKGTENTMLNHFNLYPQLLSQHYAGGIIT